MSTFYNPIQYTGLDAYSSTEILVRLDRTSLKKDANATYADLPDDFVDLVINGLAGPPGICPVFLDGIRYLPAPPPPSPAPLPPVPPALTALLNAIRAGIKEYLPTDTLLCWDAGRLTGAPSALSSAQAVTVLTNFRLRFASPADATEALDLLRTLASVAVAERAPARYIVVQESRGRDGLPRPVLLTRGPDLGDVGFTGEVLPARTALGEELPVAVESFSTERKRDEELYKLLASLNKEISAMRKSLEERKCCREEKDDVPADNYAQWPFTALHAPCDPCRGEGILIAMFDLGVDYAHPDLAGRVEIGLANQLPYFLTNNGLTPKEAEDLWASIKTVEATGQSYGNALNPNQVIGHHGTAVAGVMIGAHTGFLPKGRVLSFQVSRGAPFTYKSADGKDVKYFPVDSVLYGSALFSLAARNTDVEVLNVSLGGSAPLCQFELIGYRALASVNILTVAGSGNHFRKGDDPRVLYPARHNGILSVGAVGIEKDTNYYKRADFSNFDADDYHVNLMAPGVGILSCIPRSYKKHHDCSWFNGTSLATPWISAIYAWAIAADIAFDLPVISQKLYHQAQDTPFDAPHGYGLIKFDKLVEAGQKQKGMVLCYPAPRPKPKPKSSYGTADPAYTTGAPSTSAAPKYSS